MTTEPKIYIALGLFALITIGALLGSAVSSHRISTLEENSQTALNRADAAEQKAADLESQTKEYRAKIDYLESQLNDIKVTTKKQDETLQQTRTDTDNARRRLTAARRTQSVDTTIDDLCRKLADLGHPVRTPCVSGGPGR